MKCQTPLILYTRKFIFDIDSQYSYKDVISIKIKAFNFRASK
jgi:hypothetical protein